TTNGATKWFQDVRTVFTNGDLPDITDSIIIDGSWLAWPLTPDDHGTAVASPGAGYTILFNLGDTHGLVLSDAPTAGNLVSNPNSSPDASVFRHLRVSGGGGGVGVEIKENTKFGTGVGQHSKEYGNANLQDMLISGWGGDGVRITNTFNNIVGGSGSLQAVSI